MRKSKTNLSPQNARSSDESSSDEGLVALVAQVRSLVQSARKKVVANVNFLQIHTNFEIGRCIVEHEQRGADRAEYGKHVIQELSERLTAEFGKGFSAPASRTSETSTCYIKIALRRFARRCLANCLQLLTTY